MIGAKRNGNVEAACSSSRHLMPSECGVMSTSTAPTSSPAMIAAWMAAPIATHRSGLTSWCGRLAEPFFQQLADQRRARAAADQHHLVDRRRPSAWRRPGPAARSPSCGRAAAGSAPRTRSRLISSFRCSAWPSFSAMNSSSMRANGWYDSCRLAASTARSTRARRRQVAAQVDAVLLLETVADVA